MESDKRDVLERIMDYDTCSDYDIDEAAEEIKRLRAELAQRTAERDKTRRLYCIEMSRQSLDPKRFTPERSAKGRGWDCFDKKQN